MKTTTTQALAILVAAAATIAVFGNNTAHAQIAFKIGPSFRPVGISSTTPPVGVTPSSRTVSITPKGVVPSSRPVGIAPPTVRPSVRPAPLVPKLGYNGQFINGFGMFITSTVYGSEAERLGLQPYDMITEVNGNRLSYPGAFEDEVRNAMRVDYYGRVSGRVTLTIRDCNTGAPVYRTTYLANW